MKKNSKKNKTKIEIRNIIENAGAEYSAMKKDGSTSDVLGSYTGNPLEGEQPVQDADDL